MVTTRDTETVDAFSSHVICAKTGTGHTSERINVMTQALCSEDSSLPQDLMVQNAYTKLRKGSKNVFMVVRNSTACPQTLKEEDANSEGSHSYSGTWAPCTSWLSRGAGNDHGHQVPKLTVKQRQEKLFEELALSGLESWPSELVASTQSWLSTTTFLHWSPANLSVLIPPNMW